MSLSALPMDVWGRIASFLPTSERIPAFWTLRRALVIRTEQSVFNTLMLFVGEAAKAEELRACENMGDWPVMPVWHPSVEGVLESMGFEIADAVRALVATDGHVDLALALLLSDEPF